MWNFLVEWLGGDLQFKGNSSMEGCNQDATLTVHVAFSLCEWKAFVGGHFYMQCKQRLTTMCSPFLNTGSKHGQVYGKKCYGLLKP